LSLLTKIFEEDGKILRIYVYTNGEQFHVPKDTAVAFVTFETPEQARKACEKNGMDLNDHPISVIINRENPKDTTKYKIFVKHISTETTQSTLHHHFSQCGKVEFVSPSRESIGNSKAAIIGFSTKESVNNAISKLNYSMLDDRLIYVEEYHPNSPPSTAPKRNFQTPRRKSLKKFAATTSIATLKKKIFNPKKKNVDTNNERDGLELDVASPPNKNRRYIKVVNKDKSK